MKKSICLVLFLLCAVCLMGQNAGREVIKLKNGSVLKGEVVGELSDSLALQGADGSMFIFAISDIAERTKEATHHATATAHGVTLRTAEPTLADTLAIEADLLKFPRLTQNGLRLKERELKTLFADNPVAARHFRIASDLGRITEILEFASGFILGWELVNVGLLNKEFNTPLACIGAGSFVGALCLNIAVNNQAREAVRAYNDGIESLVSPRSEDLSLSIGATPGGVGLRITF
jgi:hypothetical protein